MSESSEDFREFKFDLNKHEAKVQEKLSLLKTMNFWNQVPDTKTSNKPKYWMMDKTIPVHMVTHPNPARFLKEGVQPLLTEMAKAIARARITKKQIKICAWIELEDVGEKVQKDA